MNYLMILYKFLYLLQVKFMGASFRKVPISINYESNAYMQIDMFDMLCNEILFSIFEYLNPSDLINVRLLGTRFNELIKENELLWKLLYEKDFDVKHKCCDNLSYKNKYKKCHEMIIVNQNLNIRNFDNATSLQKLFSIFKMSK